MQLQFRGEKTISQPVARTFMESYIFFRTAVAAASKKKEILAQYQQSPIETRQQEPLRQPFARAR